MDISKKELPAVSRDPQPSFLQISTIITIVLFLVMIAIPLVGAVVQGMSSDPTAGQGFGWIGFPILIIVAPFFILSLIVTIIAMFTSAVQDTKKRLQHKADTPSAQSPAATELPEHTWNITPLFEAILEQNSEALQTELSKNPKGVNLVYAPNGNTPLHVAVFNGYTEGVRILLQQPGLDIARQNLEGKTALDLAREKGVEEIIKLLEK